MTAIKINDNRRRNDVDESVDIKRYLSSHRMPSINNNKNNRFTSSAVNVKAEKRSRSRRQRGLMMTLSIDLSVLLVKFRWKIITEFVGETEFLLLFNYLAVNWFTVNLHFAVIRSNRHRQWQWLRPQNLCLFPAFHAQRWSQWHRSQWKWLLMHKMVLCARQWQRHRNVISQARVRKTPAI